MLGQHVLDELLSERDKINAILQEIIDEATSPWGIKVSIVEVKDVEIPAGMQRAMARQAEAERERRAKVISAEGEFQASERLKDAAIVMAASPMALQLRYLQTLLEIGATNSTTIVFPAPIDLIRPFLGKGGGEDAGRDRELTTSRGAEARGAAADAVGEDRRGRRPLRGRGAVPSSLGARSAAAARRAGSRTPRRGEPRRLGRHRTPRRRLSPPSSTRGSTRSPSRRRITITPWVARPERLIPSTGIRITVPPSEISIT